MTRRPPNVPRKDWWSLPRETRRQLVRGLHFLVNNYPQLMTEHGLDTARRLKGRTTRSRASWRWSLGFGTTEMLIALVVFSLAACLGIVIYFAATHSCVSYRTETHMSCYNMGGFIDCHPYDARVCAEWVEK